LANFAPIWFISTLPSVYLLPEWPKTIPAKRIRQSDLWFEQGELSRAARVQWKIRDTLNRLNKRGLLASDGTGHGVLWRSDGRAGQQKKHFS
jgi:hypothetical protein